ncbi:MAG: hypothetical protein O7G30_04150 [Proteobacteria bacterium]|nr:hypothetical protein [Pseudomonadota bacterium]
MANLVLGAVYRYAFDRVRPFAASLRDSGFDGKVVLFCADIDPESQRRIREFGIEIEPFQRRSASTKQRQRRARLWRRVSRLGRGPARRSSFWLLQVQVFRFFLYQRYLERAGGDYGRVLLTDVKDVVFQADPFASGGSRGIDAFQETNRLALRDEPTNRRWMEQLFGESAVAELGDFPILCSGTILGDPESLVAYVDRFLQALRGAYQMWDLGVDQGVHNYVVRKGLVSDCRIVPNGEGSVLTLGSGSEDEFGVDGEGRITNGAGRVVPVVHQYDRHPELVELVNRKFGAGSG